MQNSMLATMKEAVQARRPAKPSHYTDVRGVTHLHGWQMDLSRFIEGDRHNQLVHQLTRYTASVCEWTWSRQDYLGACLTEALRALETGLPRDEIERDAKSVGNWCYAATKAGILRRPQYGPHIGPCRIQGLTNDKQSLRERQAIGGRYGGGERINRTHSKIKEAIDVHGVPKSKAELARWTGLTWQTIHNHADFVNEYVRENEYQTKCAYDRRSDDDERERGNEFDHNAGNGSGNEANSGRSDVGTVPTRARIDGRTSEGQGSRVSGHGSKRGTRGKDPQTIEETEEGSVIPLRGEPSVVSFSTVPGTKATKTKDHAVYWDDFVRLVRVRARMYISEKENRVAMICSEFAGAYRKNINVVRATNLLSVDFDAPTKSLSDVTKLLKEQGVAMVGWETTRSTPEQPRYRLVFPVSKPLDTRKSRKAWMTRIGRVIDETPDLAVSDAARLHYLPHDNTSVYELEGREIDTGESDGNTHIPYWAVSEVLDVIDEQIRTWTEWKSKPRKRPMSDMQRAAWMMLCEESPDAKQRRMLAKEVGWDYVSIAEEM